jgi:methylthioribose-1-phosphate isomerase
MNIDGRNHRTIWIDDDGWSVHVIDQRKLPFSLETSRLTTLVDACDAIRSMVVRGAPLIGITAAYGLCLALRVDSSDESLMHAYQTLLAARPTAINLKWALDEIVRVTRSVDPKRRSHAAYAHAALLVERDVSTNRAIGDHGLPIIERLAAQKRSAPVNILTHCNAGWLGCVDWGTALAPVYKAHDKGIPVHVFVSETRPRNQGGALTAYELGAHGVAHSLIADSAAAHFMQRRAIDLCLVGADRATAGGSVVNKIGTYGKALAARHNQIPFYVALPASTIDWTLLNGEEIPIEERDSMELTHIAVRTTNGPVLTIQIAAPGSAALNPAFDLTPADLITGLITERGIAPATQDGLSSLFRRRPIETCIKDLQLVHR